MCHFIARDWRQCSATMAVSIRRTGQNFQYSPPQSCVPTGKPSAQPNFRPRTAGAARYVSSGSTGRPTAFYRSALSEAGQNAAHYRHYRAFKLDPQRNLAMIRAFDTALARSRPVPAERSKIPWATEWFAGGPPGIIQQLTVFTPVASQVEWLRGLGESLSQHISLQRLGHRPSRRKEP